MRIYNSSGVDVTAAAAQLLADVCIPCDSRGYLAVPAERGHPECYLAGRMDGEPQGEPNLRVRQQPCRRCAA